jgi:hypothetical protein
VYIRRRLNKSGSTSVHILRKEHGRQVFVESMGVGNTQMEIERLEIRARTRIREITQQSEISFIDQESEKQYFETTFNQVKRVQIIGYDLLLGKLYAEIGFSQLESSLFRALVLTRVSHPGSKMKAVEYMRRNHGIDYDLSTVYRFMDELIAKYNDLVQGISFEHTQALLGGKIGMVFYDVTTLYFEAEHEDDIRKLGYSKDGKLQRPQIVLGLLVSKGGYPLAYEMFEGNTFEGKTMLPVIEKFEHRYGLSNSFIIADAAMLSKKNLEVLQDEDREYIVGARIKSSSEQQKKQIMELNLKNGQSHSILLPDGRRLIISMSDKRAAKDLKNRQRGIARLEKSLKSGKLTKAHVNNRGYNKFLEMQGHIDVKINRDKIKEDSGWDGLKGYITNSDLSNDDIIQHYSELWQIEKAFRISKTDLRIRPIYHRLKRRIQAHLIIAFTAYKVYKELERQLQIKELGISVTQALRIMGATFGITLQHPETKATQTLPYSNSNEHKLLFDAFEI